MKKIIFLLVFSLSLFANDGGATLAVIASLDEKPIEQDISKKDLYCYDNVYQNNVYFLKKGSYFSSQKCFDTKKETLYQLKESQKTWGQIFGAAQLLMIIIGFAYLGV